jgi:hypothetical protein
LGLCEISIGQIELLNVLAIVIVIVFVTIVALIVVISGMGLICRIGSDGGGGRPSACFTRAASLSSISSSLASWRRSFLSSI